MNKFSFTRGKEEIKSVINRAESYLNIVSFQFTDEDFIRKYILKKAQTIRIEILTLPLDSYKNKNKRNKIEQLYKDLETAGVHISVCNWEVGDASLTNTSQSGDEKEGGGNKWYSMHGKFIYSEKEVLMMTANFDDSEELESYLLMQNPNVVAQFNDKFLYLKKLFIDKHKYSGNLYELCTDEEKKSISELYDSEYRLNILQYPPSLISEIKDFSGIKILPFDGVGREYLYQFINNARTYLYLSTERLADYDLINVLVNRKRLGQISIKIMTCRPGLQRDRKHPADKYILRLLSNGIGVALYKDIHAKCWISDDVVGLGSVNLGQMNLGIKKNSGYWRANTETFYFTNDKHTNNQAKLSFEQYFAEGEEPLESIATSSKYMGEAKELFDFYGATSSLIARATINQIRVSNTIKDYQHIDKIVSLAVKFSKRAKEKKISKTAVLSALILFYLTDRKHDNDELYEKLKPMICDIAEFNLIVQNLFLDNYVEIQDGYIKINSEQLLHKT